MPPTDATADTHVVTVAVRHGDREVTGTVLPGESWGQAADRLAGGIGEPVADDLSADPRRFVVDADLRIGLRAMTRGDLPMVTRWRQQPHVLRWWRSDGEPTADRVAAAYEPDIDGTTPTRMWVVEVNGRSVGFVQDYRIRDYPEFALLTPDPDAIVVVAETAFVAGEVQLHRPVGEHRVGEAGGEEKTAIGGREFGLGLRLVDLELAVQRVGELREPAEVLCRVEALAGVAAQHRLAGDQVQDRLGVPEQQPDRDHHRHRRPQRLPDGAAHIADVMRSLPERAGDHRRGGDHQADAEDHAGVEQIDAERARRQRLRPDPAEQHHVGRRDQRLREVGQHEGISERHRRPRLPAPPVLLSLHPGHALRLSERGGFGKAYRAVTKPAIASTTPGASGSDGSA